MLPAVEYVGALVATLVRRMFRLDDDEREQLAPNRMDRRAAGDRPGRYRQPRGLPRRTGQPGWWPA